MLSQEIYDSWNAKTVTDLKELLNSVSGPTIPANVRSKSFKKTVLQKIEKRRAGESHLFRNTSHPRVESTSSGCRLCSCLCRGSIYKGKYFECKALSAFDTICVAATDSFTRLISLVKALIQRLSYWESIKPGTDGLSVIGGDLWLLTYACQHLIDSPQTKEQYSMQAHLVDIKEIYQELGQAGELFLEFIQSFYNQIQTIRADGLFIVKRLAKKWSLKKENNPLHVRSETQKQIPRPRKRLGSGLSNCIDPTEEDEEIFSVRWSPLTVCIQLKSHENTRAFGRLHPQDRMTIFRKFLRATLNKVETAAEDLTSISNEVTTSDAGTEYNLSSHQIVLSMLGYAKSKHVPKVLRENEMERFILILNEFWYSVDVLNENVYILMRLVQETRDIIRTCYVYADVFYKWQMPCYDTYTPKHRFSIMSNKELLHKFTPSKTNLCDATSIVSLMDYSSSIYQGVVQEIPIHCEGMTFYLRMNDLDIQNEPSGLVSEIVDKRKNDKEKVQDKRKRK